MLSQPRHHRRGQKVSTRLCHRQGFAEMVNDSFPVVTALRLGVL